MSIWRYILHLKLLIVFDEAIYKWQNLQTLCIQLKSDVSHMIVDRSYFFVFYFR